MYKDGAEKDVFPSMWQRSLYNVDTLTARPWWTLKQTGHETELKVYVYSVHKASNKLLIMQ